MMLRLWILASFLLRIILNRICVVPLKFTYNFFFAMSTVLQHAPYSNHL
jgi:hypothetical protein